jgi:hypothetical protein
MRYFLMICALLVAAMLAHTPAAYAQRPNDTAARCAALPGQDFSQIQDAPARIETAVIVMMRPTPTRICQADGFVSGNDGFSLALPLTGWNGKYAQGGCAGACGVTVPFWCFDAVKRGYACLSGDMGHRGKLSDWSWARDNVALKADFGFRSTHAYALAGRAITAAFYGSAPKHAYFMGCSTGGRQAYTEAQRFPTDFDGIIAGSPPLSEVGSGLQLAWSVLSNIDASGHFILLAPQATLLHQAVLGQCDMNDGVKDGMIGDPRLCHFDPGTLLCKTGSAGDQCLTPAQVAAARKMYAGPHDTHGQAIGTEGGLMPGSELNWIGDYMPKGDKPPQYLSFMTSFFRYIAFDPAPPTSWNLSDLDFDHDPARFGDAATLFDATNPDLHGFRDAGGKLLAFQGWEDTSVVPMGTLNYYDAVTREMGGVARTHDFYKLFVVPGMRHCSSDSDGADVIDYLGALDDWVETGQSPQSLLGHQVIWPGPIVSTPIFPVPAADIRKTRVVYPYPAEAKFLGGDPNDPGSWKASPGLPQSAP